MKAELQQKLYDKYPLIFQDANKSMQETCMCWGISIGDGWYNLIDNLCEELTNIMKKYDVTIIADQVKEKYGTLRFYEHTTYGERWTTRDAWFARFLRKITSRLSYRRFKFIRQPIDNFISWRIKHELRLDGKVKIEEERGGWIKSNTMFAEYGVRNLIQDAISKYEDFSSMVCENCGMQAKLSSTNGWCSTVCDKCSNQRQSTSKE